MNRKSPFRIIAGIIVLLLALGLITIGVLYLINKSDNTKTAVSKGTGSSTQQTSSPNKSGSSSSQSTPAPYTSPNSSSTSTNPNSSTNKDTTGSSQPSSAQNPAPQDLAHTGPGDVVAIFLCSVILSTLGAGVYQQRRANS